MDKTIKYLERILVISFSFLFIFICGWAQSAQDSGYRKEYYESGKLLSETDCLQKDSSGVYREYFENGNLKMQVHYDGGQLHGPYADYCEDGSPHVKFEYKSNKRDGKYTLYYDNGQLQAEGVYKDGKEVGLHKVFHPNGQVAAEVNYVDGKEEGVAKTFYQDGSRWEEFSYKAGVRNGKYLEYHSKGILRKEIEYKDGEVMRAVNYDEERRIILEVLNEKFIKPIETQISGPWDLHKCVSEEVGIAFACDPDWKLNRLEKTLKITISNVPRVEMMIEETDQKLHFMHEFTREALAGMNRYEDDFHIERLRHCERETVKVNGYLKGQPNVRVSDFYLIDHLHIHTVQFTVDPKEAWENYKWLIKDIVDSLSFNKHKLGIKFVTEETNETCEDLLE